MTDTDLVKWLRDEAQQCERARHTHWVDPDKLIEAADEIDRLRVALREIVAFDASHYAHDGNARIVNIARAALKEQP